MQAKEQRQEKKTSRWVQLVIILLLLLLCISIPAIVISISMQNTEDTVMLDGEPLNKKQGLPQQQRHEPAEKDN